MLKQADLKTSEWNKFYSSFLTEVSSKQFFTICSNPNVFFGSVQMKNTFIEELKKYERRALEPWMTKAHMTSQ